ncbi:MAG: hypothetical protein RR942_14130 [Romboutsia sp.]
MYKECNNFELDIRESNERLINIRNDVSCINNEYSGINENITNTKSIIKEMEKVLGINTYMNEDIELYNNDNLEWDDNIFLTNNYIELEDKIKKEIYKNPQLLPKLDKIDWAVIGIAGVIASIIDFIVVSVPKDINYLNKYKQNGSDLTKFLKSIGIDENGKLAPMLQWCENKFKVPFDISVDKDLGLYPKNHRLRSLGHDPLFGLIFGIIDIINGTITVFDKKGAIKIVQNGLPIEEGAISAPIVWVGHIISDICTRQGLPVPGWGFLQILQVGSFGEKDRSIAQISEWMYLNGYDLRHFATMSAVPAIIEIIIRAYHGLSQVENNETVLNSIAENEIKEMKDSLKLQKMLFLSHGFATSGNVIKVLANEGNPLAINVSEWSFFIKESIKMTNAVTRDTTIEKTVRNRENINNNWESIKSIEIGTINKNK